ncbi:hypothetical protein [Thioalkalivibrio sp. ALJT]|uniref:hypothetical protein n=1 Tax=Thioalkalivibrio sp. ALJT TaxID=1158146 RepID=UPI00036F63BC|nr:hypothetical protein [Thioalkalivibrio sp. ALJT]
MSNPNLDEFSAVREEADEADARSRRVELIVYAALVAFVVLAIYGFWLITSLTRDVSQLTEEISLMTRVVDRDMSSIAADMNSMDHQMTEISGTMRNMTDEIVGIASNTDSMDANIGSMTRDTSVMAGSITGMQHDMWSLNRNVGAPMGMMNMFNPFSDQGGPARGSPGPYHPR